MPTRRSLTSGCPLLSWGTGLLWLASVLTGGTSAADEGRTGEQIYREQCASCHGGSGEGTPDNYPQPLVGRRSPESLARFIDQTMPDGAPEECTGEEARR